MDEEFKIKDIIDQQLAPQQTKQKTNRKSLFARMTTSEYRHE